MDFLKILSRSSNLSRDSNRNSTGVRANGTSTATAAPPQQPASAPSTSRKRKRSTGNTSSIRSATVGDTSDFFGTVISSKLPNSSANASSTRRNPHDETKAARESEDDDLEPQPEELGEEKCRGILRQHKVKIVQLWTPSDDIVTSKELKKEKKTSGSSKGGSNSSLDKKRRKPELLPQPLLSFEELRPRYRIHKRLASNVSAQGYRQPTEVQLGSLPLLLNPQTPGAVAQPVSLLSVAPTGSGKTISFLIPTLNTILQSRRSEKSATGLQAVILAPTKELAWQIVNEAKKLALGTGIKVVLMKKGMRMEASVEDSSPNEAPSDSWATSDSEESDEVDAEESTSSKTRPNVQPPVKSPIVVATPLTLLNALQASNSSDTAPKLPNITSLVLDEADILLDPLFREQTLAVISACSNPYLQMSMWSATMGANIESLAQSLLQERGSPYPLVRLVVGIKDTAVAHVHHRLVYAATENGKLTALRDLLRPSSSTRSSSSTIKSKPAAATAPADGARLRPPFLIFTQTIPRAIALHAELAYEIPAAAGGSSRLAVLHADLSTRAREGVMQRFRAGEIWFLITTDVLARGVDFVGLNGVVNYDFPQSAAVYVHRVGRAGRMGRSGVAVTLYAKEDVPFVKAVVNVIQASQKGQGGNSLDSGKDVDDGQFVNGSEAMNGNGLPEHLRNLPAPSKRAKKELKKYGIASRRTGATVVSKPGTSNSEFRDGGRPRKLTKTRISTKSGYDRRLDNRKRDLMASNQARSALKSGDSGDLEDGDDFVGFD